VCAQAVRKGGPPEGVGWHELAHSLHAVGLGSVVTMLHTAAKAAAPPRSMSATSGHVYALPGWERPRAFFTGHGLSVQSTLQNSPLLRKQDRWWRMIEKGRGVQMDGTPVMWLVETAPDTHMQLLLTETNSDPARKCLHVTHLPCVSLLQCDGVR
jgi:hypothetical protein